MRILAIIGLVLLANLLGCIGLGKWIKRAVEQIDREML